MTAIRSSSSVTAAPARHIPPDVPGLHNMETTCWRSPFGHVDRLLGIPEKSQYERAQYKKLAEDVDALIVEFADSSVIVASLKAIIRSKQIADREKDHEALPELIALEERSSAPEPGPDTPPAAAPKAIPATAYKPPTPGRPGGLGR
jgi:hypothetical protein